MSFTYRYWKVALLALLTGVLALFLSGCEVVVSTNDSPDAGIDFDQNSDYAPARVDFTSVSSDSDGDIISHDWDFGDGATDSGINVSHTYQDDGYYTITLTVTDDEGATDTATVNIKVLNPPPVSDFSYSPQEPVVGETVYLDAGDSFDPASVKPQFIKHYDWYFDDGTHLSGIRVQKVFYSPGIHEIIFEAQDDDGAYGSVSKEIEVEAPPIADFSWWKVVETCSNSKSNTEESESSPQLVPVPCEAEIKFDATDSEDSYGYITSYEWSFGDGSSTVTQTPKVTHWYKWPQDANYEVTLTVVDSAGLESSVTKEVRNKN